ncbi:hypothetical protein THAOC_29830, partial [Thalassiosira oceanica]
LVTSRGSRSSEDCGDAVDNAPSTAALAHVEASADHLLALLGADEAGGEGDEGGGGGDELHGDLVGIFCRNPVEAWKQGHGQQGQAHHGQERTER